MFTIISAMSDLERDVIRERTAEYARYHGVRSGMPIGRPRPGAAGPQIIIKYAGPLCVGAREDFW